VSFCYINHNFCNLCVSWFDDYSLFCQCRAVICICIFSRYVSVKLLHCTDHVSITSLFCAFFVFSGLAVLSCQSFSLLV